MNSAQMASLLRTLAQMLVAYAVGRGWIDPSIAGGLADQVVAVVIAAATLGVTLYGLKGRGNTAIVAQAAGVPGVQAIVAAPAIAAAVAHDKVQAEPGTGA